MTMDARMSLSGAAEVCDALSIDIVTDGSGRHIAVPSDEVVAAQMVEAIGSPERPSGARLAPLGTGSSFGWCRPDHDEETLCISTCGMVPEGASGIVEYVPGDGVITAFGGASIAELRNAVRVGGHRLTPAIAGTATLGGVLAAGRSGIDRCAFGPARHHVLGMRVLDGGGRITRSGGRLVKNVTGFDLFRLHVGARGSLGIILEVSMRLMPAPETELIVHSTAFATAAEAVATALEIRADRSVAPKILCVHGTKIVAGLIGRERQVSAARRALEVHVGVSFEESGERAMDELMVEADLGNTIRLSTRPSQCRELAEALESAGIDPSAFRVEPDAALIDVRTDAVREHEAAFMDSVAPKLVQSASTLTLQGSAPRSVSDLARSLSRVAAPQRTWTNRIYTSFDPHGLLRIRGQHQFSA